MPSQKLPQATGAIDNWFAAPGRLREAARMRFVIRAREADLHAPVGGKARALASLRLAGLPIPAWLVVTPDAFHKSLSPEQDQALHAARDADAIRAVVEQVRPAAEVLRELLPKLDELCADGAMVAVRCAASNENG